jgi:hypothetical protein
MKYFKNIPFLFKRMLQWFRRRGSISHTFQVNPLIVLTVIGLITTSWGLGTGIGAEKLGNELSQNLRNSPQNIENLIEELYENNQISGTQREIELQKLQEMTPLFLSAADAIQDKGQDIGFQTAAQALFETMMNFGPGGKAGSLVGASSTGQGLDQLYSIKNIIESIESSSISWTPFSEEEAQLAQQIQDILETDIDALFAARMRTMINMLRNEYIALLKKNPCDKDQILADMRTRAIGLGWGKGTDVYGEGEKFPSYEAFIDWLIAQATAIDIDVICEEPNEESNDPPLKTEEGEDTLANCNATQLVEVTNGKKFDGESETGTPYCEYSMNITNTSKDEAIWIVYLLHRKDGYQNTESWDWFALGWLGYFEPGQTFEWTGNVWKNYLVDKDFSGPNIEIMEKVAAYRDTEVCRLLQGDETFYEDIAVPVQSLCPYE